MTTYTVFIHRYEGGRGGTVPGTGALRGMNKSSCVIRLFVHSFDLQLYQTKYIPIELYNSKLKLNDWRRINAHHD